MTNKTYFKTTETAQVDNYPYGRLRATVTFGLEHKSKKGFRSTFQSIDPKTGRINKPKLSTYHAVIVMYRDETTGHIKYDYFGLNGKEEINRATAFIGQNFDLFTPEQLADIYADIIMHLKVEAYSICRYAGAKPADVLPLLKDATEAAVRGLKSNGTINEFPYIKLDEAALEATKVEGYNPFVTTTYMVTSNGLQQVANDEV